MNQQTNFNARRAAELAESRSIGHVPSPVASGIGNKQFGLHMVSVTGGQSFPLTAPGNYVYVLSIRSTNFEALDTGTVYAKTSNGDILPIEVLQRGYRLDRPFTNLEFFNTAGAGLTAVIRVFVGFGGYDNDSTDVRTSPIKVESSATFGTANAAPYAAGQTVGNVMTFDNIAKFSPLGGILTKARLTINTGASIANSNFTLYLFNGDPTFAIADRTAFGMDGSSVLKLVGIINFPGLANFPALGAGVGGLQACFGMVDGLEIQYSANFVGTTGPALRGVLVANGAFVPNNPATWTVLLGGEAYLAGYSDPSTVYRM